jgi:Protein of unknown function (DUF3159)
MTELPATQADTGTQPAEDEELPSFSEQMSQQLGGVRGLVESSIPVTAFVLVNFVGSSRHLWSLRTSLLVSVGLALVMAGYRLARRESIRHAVNGVFGILIGAAFALRSGSAKDFYLPGMIYTAVYAGAMLVSVAAQRPLVGWLWAVMLDGGATRWYKQRSLKRAFSWLTVVWATIYLLKVAVQFGLYQAGKANLLGVTRIVFGWPPYALLLALTVWSARRVIRGDPEAEPPAA